MQVARGAVHRDLVGDVAAQHGGDGRRAGVDHARVADQRDPGRELVAVLVEEGRQALAAGFLLALDQHGDAAGQGARHRLPGAAGLDEGHQLALVVGGAAAVDIAGAVVAGAELWREGVALPELDRVDRLHVVMAVEEHMRRALVAPRHGGRRRSGGRRCRRRGRRSRSRPGRRPATRPPCGTRAHRPGRWRPTGSAPAGRAARARSSRSASRCARTASVLVGVMLAAPGSATLSDRV